MSKTGLIQFGAFRLDPRRRLLLRRGKPVRLTVKAFELLLFLVQNSGRLLEKDELLDAVWPDAAVEESNLAVTISALRRALGDEHGKHKYIVTIPKRGYRFVADVTGAAGGEAARSFATGGLPGPADARPLARSILVLPFRAFGRDPGDADLGLGIAEALITRLCQLSGIVVRAARPAPPRQGIEDVAAVGSRLGAKAVLDGTIQRLGDRLRVTMRLVRVRDGAILCADQFDEQASDLLGMQDSVAERIKRTLTTRLIAEDKQRLRGRDTASTNAYHAYLKGRFHWERRTEDSLTRSIACFEQAIREDPAYASAYLGLADCYHLLSYFGAIPPSQAYPRVKAAALKALEYDAALGVAHTTLGCAHLFYEWDLVKAAREFQLALELDPDHPRVHHWSSQCSLAAGDLDGAMRALERASKLDPVSVMINTNIGLGLFYARRYDESIAELRRVIEIDPYFAVAHWAIGLNYRQKGAYRDAVREFLKGLKLSGPNALILSALGYTHALSGQRRGARKVLDELRRLSARRYVSPYSVAVVHAGLGDTDQAFAWLHKAYEDRTSWLVYLVFDPALDRLRSDRRFANLVRRIGLTDRGHQPVATPEPGAIKPSRVSEARC
jgi:DNA-binding winged helix-turn-helix (wHTH) protein/tetratricopeptide (TPR) repeat protein